MIAMGLYVSSLLKQGCSEERDPVMIIFTK
jgi:hypothetical protein